MFVLVKRTCRPKLSPPNGLKRLGRGMVHAGFELKWFKSFARVQVYKHLHIANRSPKFSSKGNRFGWDEARQEGINFAESAFFSILSF